MCMYDVFIYNVFMWIQWKKTSLCWAFLVIIYFAFLTSPFDLLVIVYWPPLII